MAGAPKQLDSTASLHAHFGWRVRTLRGDRSGIGIAGHIKRSVSLVSRIETAEVWPTAEVAAALDEALGAGGELVALQVLVEAEREREQRETRGGCQHTTSEAHPLLASVGHGSGAIVVCWRNGEVHAMPTRREFLELLGVGTAAGAIAPALRTFGQEHPGALEALEASRRAGMTSLSSGVVEQLTLTTDDFSHRFFNTAPGQLTPQVFAARLYVGALLDGKLTLGQHRELVILAGWLAALLACLVSDLGDRQAAAAWSLDALERGKEAESAELTAWAYEIRALLAFYAGRAADALNAAQAGQAIAPTGSPVMVQLLGQELRADGRLGKADEAEDAMRRAEAAARALPSAAYSDKLFGVNMVSLPYYATTAFLALDRPQQAERHVREVIADLHVDRHPTMSALAHIDLGLVLAGLGQPEGAYEAGLVALDSPRLAGSTLTRARELDAALQRRFPGIAATRDFHERYVETRWPLVVEPPVVEP